MQMMEALVRIENSIGTFEVGQHFGVLDDEYARTLISQNVAKAVVPMPRFGPDWKDASVVILASGPSLTEEHCEQVRAWRENRSDRKVVAINTTFQLAPWADVIYACDGRWWKAYFDSVKAVATSQLWTQELASTKEHPELHHVKSERLVGLGRKIGVINQGANSGYQAINLAWQFGAKKIVLLGFDMRESNKKSHWHGDHPSPMKASNPYKLWIANFEALAKDLADEGCSVVNCTPDTALQAFAKKDLSEALA